MYEFLEGRVSSKGAARLVLEVGGVGYSLAVPVGARWPEVGETARAWTHLVVREDLLALYGFADEADRELFRLLLAVRGVGPGMALGVLSGMARDELCAAIAAEDVKSLQTVKGIGKRTAEQIVLDLREKVAALPRAAAVGAVVPAAPPQARLVEDAVAALLSIGYSEREARKQVTDAARRVGDADLEVLVRAALHP